MTGESNYTDLRNAVKAKLQKQANEQQAFMSGAGTGAGMAAGGLAGGAAGGYLGQHLARMAMKNRSPMIGVPVRVLGGALGALGGAAGGAVGGREAVAANDDYIQNARAKSQYLRALQELDREMMDDYDNDDTYRGR